FRASRSYELACRRSSTRQLVAWSPRSRSVGTDGGSPVSGRPWRVVAEETLGSVSGISPSQRHWQGSPWAAWRTLVGRSAPWSLVSASCPVQLSCCPVHFWRLVPRSRRSRLLRLGSPTL